jgi:hypothetical protein
MATKARAINVCRSGALTLRDVELMSRILSGLRDRRF